MAPTSRSISGASLGDDRNTFLALTNRADADGGLQLRASEPDGATGNFRPTAIIATGITRSVWHRLDIVANFLDGPANDTVAYALDGVPLANPARRHDVRHLRGLPRRACFPYVLSNRLFFRSGAAPSALWRIRRHGRPGLLLRRPVLRRREPVGTGHPAGRLRDGVRAGLLRRFDPGPGKLVRRNDPDRRERRPDRRPDPVSTNAPGREPGGSRTTPRWATTTGPSPGGRSARASRCPLASRHPGPAPISSPRRCGSAPRVRQPMAPTSRSISGTSPAMTATPSWR